MEIHVHMLGGGWWWGEVVEGGCSLRLLCVFSLIQHRADMTHTHLFCSHKSWLSCLTFQVFFGLFFKNIQREEKLKPLILKLLKSTLRTYIKGLRHVKTQQLCTYCTCTLCAVCAHSCLHDTTHSGLGAKRLHNVLTCFFLRRLAVCACGGSESCIKDGKQSVPQLLEIYLTLLINWTLYCV